jgi:glycosyltransferase involved in cell wall biosynthesis
VWQESLALRDAGYDVVVVCPRGERNDTESYAVVDGIEIHRYPIPGVTRGWLGYIREYAAALWHSLRIVLKLGRFDVVQACNPPDLFFLVALPLRLRGARFIFDQHDLVPELYLSRFGRGQDILYHAVRFAERCTYGLADVVIATNDSYREVALERSGKRAGEIFVVRSAPSLDQFQAVPPDPELKRGKPHLLCYLGVMGPQDGVDHALRALAHLKERRDDWHAVFMGSGDVFDDMVALSRELGLRDHVTFTGRVSNEDLLRYLSTADIGLAPDPLNPLNDLSTMNKILEYMSVGTPLVSFDLHEARVSAGDAAVYAPANDERAFAEAISQLLDDPADRERRGRLGRERMEQQLSWEHSRRALLDAYAAALA